MLASFLAAHGGVATPARFVAGATPALWLGAVALGAVVAHMVRRCKRAPEPPAMPHALPESAR